MREVCTCRIVEYDEMWVDREHVATLVSSQRSTVCVWSVCPAVEHDEMNVERGHSDHFMEVE